MAETTSVRLKQLMAERKLKQVDILQLTKPYCEKYGASLSKSDLSQFVNGKVVPGQQKLTILGLALNVSEAWLMGLDVPMQRGLTACPVCEFVYAADLEPDALAHERYHDKFVAARNYFGRYHSPSECERIKKHVCPLLLNSQKESVEKRCDATIRLFETYFSGSVLANGYSLAHPTFDEYVSMLLNQHHWQSSMDKDVYSLLVYKYKKTPGLPEGRTIYKIEPSKDNNACLKPDEQLLIDDYRKLNDQGQEYIRQTMYMAKQTYKKITSTANMEKIG